MQVKSQEDIDWLRLMLCAADLGAEGLGRLLQNYGSSAEIVRAGRREVAQVIGKEASLALFSDEKSRECEEALAWLQETDNAAVLVWSDEEFPKGLLALPRPPSVLYLRGRREILSRRRINLTGTRRPDAEGLRNAQDFGCAVAKNAALVTGLEEGVELASAEAALTLGDAAQGAVIVVQATGPDRLYPAHNRGIFYLAAEHGLLVSPFAPHAGFDKEHEAVRRTVGMMMSEALFVVQSELGSESLSLAREAAEAGREVYTIPGSIHSTLYKGNHKLLREGAGLVETIRDLGLGPQAAP